MWSDLKHNFFTGTEAARRNEDADSSDEEVEQKMIPEEDDRPALEDGEREDMLSIMLAPSDTKESASDQSYTEHEDVTIRKKNIGFSRIMSTKVATVAAEQIARQEETHAKGKWKTGHAASEVSVLDIAEFAVKKIANDIQPNLLSRSTTGDHLSSRAPTKTQSNEDIRLANLDSGSEAESRQSSKFYEGDDGIACLNIGESLRSPRQQLQTSFGEPYMFRSASEEETQPLGESRNGTPPLHENVAKEDTVLTPESEPKSDSTKKPIGANPGVAIGVMRNTDSRLKNLSSNLTAFDPFENHQKVNRQKSNSRQKKEVAKATAISLGESMIFCEEETPTHPQYRSDSKKQKAHSSFFGECSVPVKKRHRTQNSEVDEVKRSGSSSSSSYTTGYAEDYMVGYDGDGHQAPGYYNSEYYDGEHYEGNYDYNAEEVPRGCYSYELQVETGESCPNTDANSEVADFQKLKKETRTTAAEGSTRKKKAAHPEANKSTVDAIVVAKGNVFASATNADNNSGVTYSSGVFGMFMQNLIGEMFVDDEEHLKQRKERAARKNKRENKDIGTIVNSYIPGISDAEEEIEYEIEKAKNRIRKRGDNPTIDLIHAELMKDPTRKDTDGSKLIAVRGMPRSTTQAYDLCQQVLAPNAMTIAASSNAGHSSEGVQHYQPPQWQDFGRGFVSMDAVVEEVKKTNSKNGDYDGILDVRTLSRESEGYTNQPISHYNVNGLDVPPGRSNVYVPIGRTSGSPLTNYIDRKLGSSKEAGWLASMLKKEQNKDIEHEKVVVQKHREERRERRRRSKNSSLYEDAITNDEDKYTYGEHKYGETSEQYEVGQDDEPATAIDATAELESKLDKLRGHDSITKPISVDRDGNSKDTNTSNSKTPSKDGSSGGGDGSHNGSKYTYDFSSAATVEGEGIDVGTASLKVNPDINTMFATFLPTKSRSKTSFTTRDSHKSRDSSGKFSINSAKSSRTVGITSIEEMPTVIRAAHAITTKSLRTNLLKPGKKAEDSEEPKKSLAKQVMKTTIPGVIATRIQQKLKSSTSHRYADVNGSRSDDRSGGVSSYNDPDQDGDDHDQEGDIESHVDSDCDDSVDIINGASLYANDEEEEGDCDKYGFDSIDKDHGFDSIDKCYYSMSNIEASSVGTTDGGSKDDALEDMCIPCTSPIPHPNGHPHRDIIPSDRLLKKRYYYFCERCEKYWRAPRFCKISDWPDLHCDGKHFIEILQRPNVGDHIFTSKTRFEIDNAEEFSWNLNWGSFTAKNVMPPIPERHGIYIGAGKVISFQYGNADEERNLENAEDKADNEKQNYLENSSWWQDSRLVSVQILSLKEFSEARKIYLKKIGTPEHALMAKTLLGKRGYSLHKWNCFHLTSYVLKGLKNAESIVLPWGHYGSYVLQDPVFPFGFLGITLKNTIETAFLDTVEHHEWSECQHYLKKGLAPIPVKCCKSKSSSFTCQDGHTFCRSCVQKHLRIRGIPIETWETRSGRYICPHPLCYHTVKYKNVRFGGNEFM